MAFISIRDPLNSKVARVDDDYRLQVNAVAEPPGHNISHAQANAFRVNDTATPAAATNVLLHIKNISSTMELVVTDIDVQTIGLANGTAIPDAATYWVVQVGRTWSSGGDSLTPVNMQRGSVNPAVTTVYGNKPTLAGTAVEIDRYVVKDDGDRFTFRGDGSLILGVDQTLEVSLVTDHTAGTAWASVQFYKRALA